VGPYDHDFWNFWKPELVRLPVPNSPEFLIFESLVFFTTYLLSFASILSKKKKHNLYIKEIKMKTHLYQR
jgi:hypothetical protein